MVDDIPVIGDIYGWFKGQAGDLFKIVGLDVIIDLIKELPTLIRSVLELMSMADDIVALVVKIVRFVFGDLMDLVIIILENLVSLADPLIEFVESIIKALEESKEIPTIFVYGAPMFISLWLLYYIVVFI